MSDSNNSYTTGGSQMPDYGYVPDQGPEQKGMSIASLVLGICGFIAWCIPLFGYPVTIVGIILGALGMKKGGEGYGNRRYYLLRDLSGSDSDQLCSGSINVYKYVELVC